jgi:hypothetical protein
MHCLARLTSLPCHRNHIVLLSLPQKPFAPLLPQAKLQAASAMRLLHFDVLGRLILTDFCGKPIPPYSILSHRWSDSETLIEDISNGNYKEKEEGYRKLRFCAEQAAQDGLQYSWIDTCCIDRWDNNGRSNAIKSMFQWY